jgi:hypothetical protein
MACRYTEGWHIFVFVGDVGVEDETESDER